MAYPNAVSKAFFANNGRAEKEPHDESNNGYADELVAAVLCDRTMILVGVNVVHIHPVSGAVEVCNGFTGEQLLAILNTAQ